MKILTLEGDTPLRDRPALIACATRGCVHRPSGHKPYCESCVKQMPYARDLAAEHARREADLRAAARGLVAAIDPAGSRCREILGLLVLGERTVGSLSHEVDVTGGRYGAPPIRLVRAFVAALEGAGLVRVRVLMDQQKRRRESVRLA